MSTRYLIDRSYNGNLGIDTTPHVFLHCGRAEFPNTCACGCFRQSVNHIVTQQKVARRALRQKHDHELSEAIDKIYAKYGADLSAFFRDVQASIDREQASPRVADAQGPWRVGSKVSLNVYCGGRPVCQCHNEADARRIVEAMNRHAAV